MTPVGFEPKVPARERPQIHALDRAATGTGGPGLNNCKYVVGESALRKRLPWGKSRCSRVTAGCWQ